MPKKNPRSHALLPFALVMLYGLIAARSHAEVTLDGSLGQSGPLAGPNFLIRADMGQQVDTNLFHSFGIFNINMDESATFTGEGSMGSIENVLGRVTGGSLSSIDGLLRSTIPGADLFLINPAGIMFGRNAELDVQGSFHASTADFVRLEDGVRFNAMPSAEDALLTTASPAAFGFLNENPAGISMQGSDLQVPGEETLSVISGDIEIEDGTLQAPGGRINLAAVASRGEAVPTDSDLEVGSFEALGAIDITQTASERPQIDGIPIANVDVSGEGGGAVFIRGGQFTSQGGWVFADTLGDKAGRGVDVSVEGDLVLEGGALVTADARDARDGDAGSLTVKAHSVEVRNGAVISATSFGAGNGGNLLVEADSINISQDGLVTIGGEGGGTILVQGGQLVMENSVVSAQTRGDMDGGGINVKVDSLSLVRDAFISTSAPGRGKAGNLEIQTGSLELRDGAFIAAATRDEGNGGDLLVEADSVFLAGDRANGFTGITAQALKSTGHAGDLTVKAGSLEVRSGAAITASTSSLGQGGNLLVEAESVLLSRDGAERFTGIAAQANPGSRGDAGNLTVSAGSLTVSDGAGISVSTFSLGSGGKLEVIAKQQLSLSGTHTNADGNIIPAGIFANTQGDGNAGSLTVKAGSLELRDEAEISASTSGSGNGGNLVVEADSVLLASGDIVALAGMRNSGAAGDLTVKAGSLEVRGGAVVSTATLSSKKGGDLVIEADRVLVSGDGDVATITTLTGASGDAGDLTLKAGNLELRDGVSIDADTFSTGRGGNLTIVSDDIGLHNGSTISARSTATGLDVEDSPEIGKSGSIIITAHDNLRLFNGSSVSVETAEANAGSINLNVGNLVHLRDQSGITTSVARGKGDGGNITIDPTFVVLDDASEIRANAQQGMGGEIDIRITGGGALFESPDSTIDASAGPAGIDGSVEIDAPDTDISGSIVALPAGFLNAASLLSERCAARTAETVSSFVVLGRGGVPLSPESASLGSYVDRNVTSERGDHHSDLHYYQQIANNHQITNQGALAVVELECPQ